MKCATALNSFNSPHGTPVTLTIEPDADTEVITALLDRADAIGQHYAAHGWALAEAQPCTPGPAELEAGPTFAGYPSIPTIGSLISNVIVVLLLFC